MKVNETSASEKPAPQSGWPAVGLVVSTNYHDGTAASRRAADNVVHASSGLGASTTIAARLSVLVGSLADDRLGAGSRVAERKRVSLRSLGQRIRFSASCAHDGE